MGRKPKQDKKAEAYRHDETRKNIPEAGLVDYVRPATDGKTKKDFGALRFGSREASPKCKSDEGATLSGTTGTCKRLLVIACSQRKRRDDGYLPAIERYDGPQFAVLRKHLRECEEFPVFVLSGWRGLISSAEPIPYYDLSVGDSDLVDLVGGQWQAMVLPLLGPNSDLGVALGERYIRLLPVDFDSTASRVTLIGGTQGRRLSSLKAWLSPDAAGTSKRRNLGGSLVGPFKDADVNVLRDRLETAALMCPTRTSEWHVQVGRRHAPLKRFVATLTGLPTSSFETRHAVQLARALGLEVHRGN